MNKTVVHEKGVSNKEQIAQASKRIEWIDLAKFFGMVFVVVGHALTRTGYLDDFVRGLIYTFHLPLFYILSFLTTTLSKDKFDFLRKTKKRFIHLMIPYFLFIIVCVIAEIIGNPANFTDSLFWERILMKFLGYTDLKIFNNGIEWFLILLFLGQTIFDLIHLFFKDDVAIGTISLMLTIVGVWFGRMRIFMPFMFDIVLSCFIFFFVGYKLKKLDFSKRPVLRLIICAILWIAFAYLVSLPRDGYFYYEAYARYYPAFPICFLAAVFGALTFMYISYLLCKIKFITTPFCWLGSHTLIWMLVHSFSLFIVEPKIHLSDIYYLHRFLVSISEIVVAIILVVAINALKKLLTKKRKISMQN